VLVSASLLSLRGLQQALKMNLGFAPQQVSVVAFELGLAGYSEDRGRDFQRQALEIIQRLPSVAVRRLFQFAALSMDQSHTGVFPADKRIPSLLTAFPSFTTRFRQVFSARWNEVARRPRIRLAR